MKKNSQTSSLFSDAPRLQILSAVQTGETQKILNLLNQNPDLIHARTKSRDSSLLHISAERAHEEICDLLLQKGHITNPVDNDGLTPYQRTTSKIIKNKLVIAHKDYLCNKYYSKEVAKVHTTVMDPSHFSEFIATRCGNNMENRVFGITNLRKFDINNKNEPYSITIIFREDILMKPYYGDLLVIHEHEQAVQSLELINNPEPKIELRDRHPRFEARACIASIGTSMENYAFFKEILSKEDRFDIAEAKKLFITFALTSLYENMIKCTQLDEKNSENNLTYLKKLPRYETVVRYMRNAMSGENRIINSKIVDETLDQYPCGTSKSSLKK